MAGGDRAHHRYEPGSSGQPACCRGLICWVLRGRAGRVRLVLRGRAGPARPHGGAGPARCSAFGRYAAAASPSNSRARAGRLRVGISGFPARSQFSRRSRRGPGRAVPSTLSAYGRCRLYSNQPPGPRGRYGGWKGACAGGSGGRGPAHGGCCSTRAIGGRFGAGASARSGL